MGTKVKMKYFVLLTFLLASAHCLPTKNSKNENIQTEPEYNDEKAGKDYDQNQYTEDSVEVNDYQQGDENNVNEDQSENSQNSENSEENPNYSLYESEDLEAEKSDEVFKENNEENWIDYNDKVEEEVEESNPKDLKDFVQVSEKPVILNEAEWVDYDENSKYFKDENKVVLSRGDEALDGFDVKTIPDKKAENQQGPVGNNFDEGFKARVDPINNKDDEDVVDPEFSVEDEPVKDNEVDTELSVPVS